MSDQPAPGSTEPVHIGGLVPDVSLPAHPEPVRLRDHLGSWVVLYFYAADGTRGCTAEACAFRDHFEEFTDAGAVVIGVSGDSVASHQRFAEQHRLPFTLASDVDGTLRDQFGVEKVMGLLPGRVTFVIDPQGVIRKRFSSLVRFAKHEEEALAMVRGGGG